MQAPAQAASRSHTVEAVELTKRYPLFHRRRDRLFAFLGATGSVAAKTALDRVSLEVSAGEAFGIVGENGSGKSTLLRLVAGITRPDGGTLAVTQPVSAILELGLGFHPEFTGRENAMLYGSMVGVPERSMADRLEDVLAFADIGEYADQPVRTYSSGMMARLAFAVATNVEPAVLAVDEALAVGDGAFQKKCVDRMVGFKREGRTVLFCSHSMYLVASFCARAVWLRHGRVEAIGDTQAVIPAYEQYLYKRGQESMVSRDIAGRPVVQIQDFVLRCGDGALATALQPGADYTLEAQLELLGEEDAIHLGVAFERVGGEMIGGFTTLMDGLGPLEGHSRWSVRVRLPRQPFSSGQVEVVLYVLDRTGLLPMGQARLGPLPILSPVPTPVAVTPFHEWEWHPLEH
ncbi:MAG: polysaccharide ABC transporter ATP-binding protein [Thermoanaerobaculales bacterium]